LELVGFLGCCRCTDVGIEPCMARRMGEGYGRRKRDVFIVILCNAFAAFGP
jgi:hypothetical protein